MTYTPPEGVTIGTFTADTLPISFSAPADAVISYKIYGTPDGVGEATENLWDPDNVIINARIGSSGEYYIDPDARYVSSERIECSPSTDYSRNYLITLKETIAFYDADDVFIIRIATGSYTCTSPSNAKYMRTSILEENRYNLTLVQSSTAPETFIPHGYKIPILLESGEQLSNYELFIGDTQLGEDEYVDFNTQKIYKLQEGTLTPTDPPLPLPSIITYDGENTISSTETLGDVEFTGEWTAIMGNTEDESIDIEFTVDAEEYIAFVTVDDGPSIQVSDTITMPSSADSFTLEVVSWGREQYTDTVYNALS